MFLYLLACTDAVTPIVEPALVGCEDDGLVARCAYETHLLEVDGEARAVHVGRPEGEAPVQGWPVAVLFQGSFVSGETYFTGTAPRLLGSYHQTRLVLLLLEAGYAVVAPEAQGDGELYWDTNLQPWADDWTSAPDHRLMLALDEALSDGGFGPLDPEDRVAAGISSGGYMTSRMAASYPGTYRALAIQSGSWATCLGTACTVPSELPADHPPTLFLHGANDTVVPLATNEAYRQGLAEQGTPVDLVLNDLAGHAWIPEAPEAILDWFERP